MRLPRVLDWLAQHGPDVLCLQETKVEDPAFPAPELEAAGYAAHVRRAEDVQRRRAAGAQDVAAGGRRRARPARPRRRAEARRRGLASATCASSTSTCPTGSRSTPTSTGTSSTGAAPRPAFLRAELAAHPRARRGRRLQHRTGGPRRARPRGVGRAGAVQRARAAGVPRLVGARPRRRVPPVRPAAGHLQLVGLPDAGVPQEPRAAHRPHPAVGAARGGAARRARSTATRARARSRPTTRR